MLPCFFECSTQTDYSRSITITRDYFKCSKSYIFDVEASEENHSNFLRWTVAANLNYYNVARNLTFSIKNTFMAQPVFDFYGIVLKFSARITGDVIGKPQKQIKPVDCRKMSVFGL